MPALAQGAAGPSARPWPQGGPIRLILPFGPGGATDINTRIAAEAMSDFLRQAVIIDNRPGAAGTIAAAQAARMPADGYTLFLATISTMAIAPTVYRGRLQWDPVRDFTYASMLFDAGWVLLAKAAGPYTTLDTLLAAGRRQGSMICGMAGMGSVAHLLALQLGQTAGFAAEPLPYRSTPQLTADLLNGTVQVAIDSLTATAPLIRAGVVVPLAISSSARSPQFPDLPTFLDLGMPAMRADGWVGLAAPAGTSPPILRRIAEAVQAAKASPSVRQRFAENCATVNSLALEEAQAFAAAQLGAWEPLVLASGAVPD